MPSTATLALVALVILAYLVGRRAGRAKIRPAARRLAGELTRIDEAMALDAARDVEEHLLQTWLEQERK